MNISRLRMELENRNMSVRQLAIKAGIVPQCLYAAIAGKVKFWPGWQERCADALEMDVSELFGEE